jgi:hypothetical protein
LALAREYQLDLSDDDGFVRYLVPARDDTRSILVACGV